MNRQELLSIAKPILFNTEMVRAILDGRKTVTRRLIKYPHCGYFNYEPPRVTSRYRVDDILYVRETWAAWSQTEGITPELYYKADYDPCEFEETREEIYDDTPFCIKWRPSIHMPKEAARIFLRVTDVRMERLQDITSEQIDAEGCKEWSYSSITGELLPSSPSWFKIVWNSTIKKSDLDKYGLNANPWVWVYEFERVEVTER